MQASGVTVGKSLSSGWGCGFSSRYSVGCVTCQWVSQYLVQRSWGKAVVC